jgi:hypothetical protein
MASAAAAAQSGDTLDLKKVSQSSRDVRRSV